MSSFHILKRKGISVFPEGIKYMKLKIWTCVVTAAIAVVMIRYYADDYRRGQETSAKAETENETEELPWTSLKIRVLIMGDSYEGYYHDRLEIGSTGDFYWVKGKERKAGSAGDVVSFSVEDFSEQDKGTTIFGTAEETGELIIENLVRLEEKPSYRGTLEITHTENGYVVINELPLEEYLSSVLSSEMSSAFPAEALRAQAVCARTFAVRRMQEEKVWSFDADIDDSVNDQVYNNMHGNEVTRQAVEDTKNIILVAGEEAAEIQYYSTSCGVTASDDFQDEETFELFLKQGRASDPESCEAWYRWTAVLSYETIQKNLSAMELEVPEKICELHIRKRDTNGQVLSLAIIGDGDALQVDGDYAIRQALAPDAGNLILQDDRVCASLSLLPSSWFVVENGEGEDGVRLIGGGYGHGAGMSQNGAKYMAMQGKNWEEILAAYYPGVEFKTMQRTENIER